MAGIRLRTKFLLSLFGVSLGLTCGSLFVVQQVLNREVRKEISADLQSSVLTFQNVQHQRELTLSRTAALLASLPTLRALMTTRDKNTIQDASTDTWRLAGSDLFVLADSNGLVMAQHTKGMDLTPQAVQASMDKSFQQDEPIKWWFSSNHLYEVFLQPLYFGSPSENKLLGRLAIGYEVDAKVATEVSRITSSHVAFQYGDSIVASTLPAAQSSDLRAQVMPSPANPISVPAICLLTGEKFLFTSVALGAPPSAPVRLIALKSYDQATAFLRRLNRILLTLGLIAIGLGSAMGLVISHTFTRPLKNLVNGVRSLERGDFAYPLARDGDDEVAEVTGAFDRMRQTLKVTQTQLLESERLATIGQMATSISHDLRHSLTAIMANAEFLCESNLMKAQREGLYREVRTGVNQMTDLIDSLLEFSKTRESMRPVFASLEKSIRRAIHTLHMHPDFSQICIELTCEVPDEGWFDAKKLERVFYNLLRNACEAIPMQSGLVKVSIETDSPNHLSVRIADSGSGIPEPIRDKLFEPFVSYGKENGTGLGLAIVQKIMHDHGGDICLESTNASGTVFKLILPVDFPSLNTTQKQALNNSTVSRNHL